MGGMVARRAVGVLGSEFDVNRIYDLGPFRLDVASRTLTKSGAPVALGVHAVAVLTAMVERAPQLAPKASIMDAVWPDIWPKATDRPTPDLFHGGTVNRSAHRRRTLHSTFIPYHWGGERERYPQHEWIRGEMFHAIRLAARYLLGVEALDAKFCDRSC